MLSILVQVLLLPQFIGEIRDKFCNTDERQTTKKKKGRLHDLEEKGGLSLNQTISAHREVTQKDSRVSRRGDPGAVCAVPL